MRNIRTDLAMEAFDGQGRSSLPGVDVNRWETAGVTLTEVLVTGEDAARMLGKSMGRYLTLECGPLRQRDPDARAAMESLLAEELSRMLPTMNDADCALVVGLGNRQITPDALGPAVAERVLVTRHLSDTRLALPGLRCVSAVAPGVLGVTGLETMDVVERLAGLVKPAVVICIDSLAARDAARLGTTVQLTDTGIQPGAGVGNHRRALNEDSIGAPVVAVGMPTVIHASTLVQDALEGHEDVSIPDDMIVTPREIDALIHDAAGIISAALNRALQPELSDAELAAMLD